MIKYIKIFLEKNSIIYSIFRKIFRLPGVIINFVRIFSVNNLKAYFYPIKPPDFPGYITDFSRNGISGVAFGVDREKPLKIELLIDGFIINTTYATQKVLFPTKYKDEFIGFNFPMKEVWTHISRDQKLDIRTGDGKILRINADGRRDTQILKKYMSIAVKTNVIEFINKGNYINKFGRIRDNRGKITGWLEKVSISYNTLNELFENETGKSLFIFYGTMLGFAREGGVIAHDCDLDLAYFSEKTTPREVREEFLGIAEKLIKKEKDIIPFVYKLLFKKMGLSVTPCWISEDGVFSTTFGYVGDNYRVVKEDILPLKKVNFSGSELYLPNNPVNVAKYVYGRGWKYPDPGWKWLPEYKSHKPVLEGRLTVSQVDELQKLIDKTWKA